MRPPRPAAGVTPPTVTPPILRECPGCGLFQEVPRLAAGMVAACGRCGTALRRGRADPIGRAMALNAAALVVLVVLFTTVLMNVETAGIVIRAHLLSGPEELVNRGMSALGIVVAFTTLIAPLLKLGGTLYVMVRLHGRAPPPRHLRRVYSWVVWLTPWSMIDVFLFGVFVAYVKLGDIVTISVGTGVIALMILSVLLIWAEMVVDAQAVWEAIDRPRRATAGSGAAGGDGALVAWRRGSRALLACETCGMVSEEHGVGHHAACARCGGALHARKPGSISRTWALVIAAAVLYVPANVYPVLTVVQLGAGAPSTILGGVEELVSSGMYPLAALVFIASIAVPMLKLVGLAVMLTTAQTHRTSWLRDRTRLYHFVRWIGRWSMIDIFMESLLGAMVRFGSVVTIEPGTGAVAFCAVVILTMLAAECFDPRLMWDAAARGRSSLPLPAGA